MPDEDPFEGWTDMGWTEDGARLYTKPVEPVTERLNDYVREHFDVTREEVTADGARFRDLTRRSDHALCTCPVFGILDPTITPVRVYSRDCGLLAHRLLAQPPRQEP